jgi:hypothetical protein
MANRHKMSKIKHNFAIDNPLMHIQMLNKVYNLYNCVIFISLNLWLFHDECLYAVVMIVGDDPKVVNDFSTLQHLIKYYIIKFYLN